jgi:xanthine dehydrogenase accessory factor
MRELLEKLRLSLAENRPVAYCRLVETRGSTPQKAGAAMLVYADGSQAGTLGGGCVEAEVKRKALAALQTGQAAVERFELDNDYGWDDGLICGGRMMVFIDPSSTLEARRYIEALTYVIDARRGAVEAIVFENKHGKLPVAASYLFGADGILAAQAHSTEPPSPQIVNSLPSLDARPGPSAAQGVAYLPHLPRCSLLVVWRRACRTGGRAIGIRSRL